MDRIINVKVAGSHLTKDSKNAGTRGEANITNLKITFDGGWNDFDKKVIFLDARGLNPVVIDLLPTLAEDDTTYLVPIPGEPMAIAGELTFVIEGRKDDKVQKSLADTLVVKDSPDTSNAGQPVPPTPDELTQVRQSFDELKGDIIEVKGAKAILEETAERAEDAEESAKGYSDLAMSAVGKTSYIGENGNWFAWSTELGDFYDTGTRAQAGSMVYVGDNPPDEADVWIQPTGKPTVYTSAEVDARITEELEPYAKAEQLGALATKEDLKPLATKEDLTPLATKEELSSYATQSDISVFATSEYLNTIIASLRAEMSTTPTVKKTTITLYESAWIGDNEEYYQVVNMPKDSVTANSQVDMQITDEQMKIFREKEISFLVFNTGGTVTAKCYGVRPTQNYDVQVSITEVEFI